MSVELFLEFVRKHKLDVVPVKSEQATSTAFVLYLCPGDRRLELKEGARMATADEVKEVTGHSIGGVPPFGHKARLRTIIVDGFDESAPLWAAAGAPDTNFKTTLSELRKAVERVGYKRNMG